jgi:hypothetical protein
VFLDGGNIDIFVLREEGDGWDVNAGDERAIDHDLVLRLG